MPPRRRKVLRRWPAVGQPESVTLPHIKIFVHGQGRPEPNTQGAGETETTNLTQGYAALMRAQGSEMVELMRRACFIGREKSVGEERVQLQLCERDSSAGECGDLEKAAIKWIGEMFTTDRV